jgi:tRNA G18 (ribose-2'-O)-methylase SpoU
MFMPMTIVTINSIDDPRIAAFTSLQDRTLALRHNLFVVEGEFLLQRLLTSSFQVRAVLVEEKRVAKIAGLFRSDTLVYTASSALLSRIVGFPFHRGVIGLGVRQPFPPLCHISPACSHLLYVICPEINDVENLGVMMRNAAAFGADGLVLGPMCCDPLARRAVRTSMGAVFKLPIFKSLNLESDLLWLRNQEGFQLYAAVLGGSAVPLSQMKRPARLGILFGTEANGLSAAWSDLCDSQVTIPMQMDTDSLNVGVACGIFLFHFTQGSV